LNISGVQVKKFDVLRKINFMSHDSNRSISQAGAIAFRENNGKAQVLLVRSKKDPSHWIFPKGHVEIGESLEITSSRELFEEAGIEGSIIAKAGELEFSYGDRSYHVTYYLHKFQKVLGCGELGREPQWFNIEDALNSIVFLNSRELLCRSLSIIESNL
jgi:8-oxo-dGTP pyrophosphatase MutT (NUDIX family)